MPVTTSQSPTDTKNQKDIQLTMSWNREKEQMITFDELEPETESKID